MGDDEELYGEAEAEFPEPPSEEDLAAQMRTTPAATSPNRTLGSFNEPVGMTLKERLALLNRQNNNAAAPIPIKPNVAKKPQFVNKENGQGPAITASKPAIKTSKPTVSPGSAIQAAIKKHQPVPNLSELKNKKQSLKNIEKTRDSLKLSEGDADTKTVEADITDKNGKKYKKLPFIKKFGKPPIPSPIESVALPTVNYLDVESGVERRLGASARANLSGEDASIIKSWSSEAEEEEQSSASSAAVFAPDLPSSPLPNRPKPPGPSIPALPSRPKPLPPGTTNNQPPTVEELYDEGEAAAADDQAPALDDDGQELYEDFDEVQDGRPPPPPARIPVAEESPEDKKKQAKLEREKKEKEKKEKAKLEKTEKEREKQRLKEAREREAFIKKYKLKDDDLITSHFVKAVNPINGGGKMMLSLKVNETVFLIRKNGPDGKWIVKNPKTDQLGLVDSKDMVDLEEYSPAVTNGVMDYDDNEEIYEEINDGH